MVFSIAHFRNEKSYVLLGAYLSAAAKADQVFHNKTDEKKVKKDKNAHKTRLA